jgi:hypothetical protein
MDWKHSFWCWQHQSPKTRSEGEHKIHPQVWASHVLHGFALCKPAQPASNTTQ